ncbi:MAG: hypothetical protein J6D47_17170 [Peptostreptococcaceae bacterium]|nr:hypothetical protein [Peptostreptococcaceae bacterium]
MNSEERIIYLKNKKNMLEMRRKTIKKQIKWIKKQSFLLAFVGIFVLILHGVLMELSGNILKVLDVVVISCISLGVFEQVRNIVVDVPSMEREMDTVKIDIEHIENMINEIDR